MDFAGGSPSSGLPSHQCPPAMTMLGPKCGQFVSRPGFPGALGALQGRRHCTGCRVGGHQAHSGCSGGALPLASLWAASLVLQKPQVSGPADIFSGADAKLGLQLLVAAAATLGKKHLPLFPPLLCLPLASVGVFPFFKAGSCSQRRVLVSLRSPTLSPLLFPHNSHPSFCSSFLGSKDSYFEHNP